MKDNKDKKDNEKIEFCDVCGKKIKYEQHVGGICFDCVYGKDTFEKNMAKKEKE